LEHRSRVPYESRWAPYDRTHEPGQGQLPEGSIRPRGLCLLTRPAAPPAQCSRYMARTPLCERRSPDRHAAAVAHRLIELSGDAFNALGCGIERTDHRIGRRPRAVGCNEPRILQGGDVFL